MQALELITYRGANVPNVTDVPGDVLALVNDDATSHWLRVNLFELICRRDPLDALNDAQALAVAMESWAKSVFRAAGHDLPI